MPNYQNSKIYVLRSHQTDKIYVGSTCNELRKRLHEHKRKYKCFLNNKDGYVSSFEICKFNDCYIELFLKYPCNDKDELRKKEGEIIRNLECVNKRIEGRTKKEWFEYHKEYLKQYWKDYHKKNKEKIKEYHKEHYEKNKEHLNEYRKEYYEKNKEKIKEKRKKKYICVCGSEIRKEEKSRHEKTNKHNNFINQ